LMLHARAPNYVITYHKHWLRDFCSVSAESVDA
jgi:hypothetical protein